MNQDYYSIGMVLVSLIAIMNLANLAISIWSRTRRRPSIDVSLQEYVKRTEFESLRNTLNDTNRQIFDLLRKQQDDTSDKISQLMQNLAEWQRGMERQIGRIEGGQAKGNRT